MLGWNSYSFLGCEMVNSQLVIANSSWVNHNPSLVILYNSLGELTSKLTTTHHMCSFNTILGWACLGMPASALLTSHHF